MAEEKPQGPELHITEGGAASRAEREAAFRKELDTPIDRDEAEKLFADIDVQLAQLSVQRIRAVAQMDQAKQLVNHIDEQIGIAQLERQIVYRRALNAAPAPEAETEPKPEE